MKYSDRNYGEFEINEPVLVELINCGPLQRLKGIDQAGYYEPHFPGISHSRFEHSMGVFCLLRMYGAGVEEQIAGLIHDVSHSAFSHCIDYAMEGDSGKGQGHQDSIFEEFVKRSEIPEILGKYGIKTDYVLNDDNFPLKERLLPDLCADRIDYSLRTARIMHELSAEEVSALLSHLKVVNRTWVFDGLEWAKKYARLFRLLNEKYYSGTPSAAMHFAVGAYLRHALDKGYIVWEDLYTTDAEVLKRIEVHHKDDARLMALFDRMNLKVPYVNDPDNFERRVYNKSRLVDPLFIDGAGFKRVSDLDAEWKELMKEGLKPKEHFIRFLG